MSKKNPTESDRTSRRRFLTTFALGASAAPFLSWSRSLIATGEEATVPGLCYSNKRVIGPADLRYLGAMRVPASGVDMTFSGGAMTGRKVNGQVQLLIAGSSTIGDPMYELADKGTYHPDPAQAPRMSLVRNWGRIYGQARTTWLSDGTVRNTAATDILGSLHFNPATQLLYWTYYDTYNVSKYEDWCLAATKLDASGPVAFGPWRPSGDGRKGPWRCIQVGEHPLTGQLLCGSRLQSGNISSPWGPDMWFGQFPTAATPSGFGAPDLPVQKYLTYYPMLGRVNSDGTYSGALRAFRRPGDYFFEPIAGASGYTQIDPQKNGGIGSWTELDSIRDHVWIDLPDAHGVIFTGKLASQHIWYRNAGMGNELCTHGQASPVDITGPVSTDAYPAIVVYDPNDLEAVRNGSRVDYTIDPVHVINAKTTFGAATAQIREVGTARTFDGIYFDAATRRLYIAAPQADATIGGLLNPLVHVFHIA